MDIYDTAGEQIARAFNDRKTYLDAILLDLRQSIIKLKLNDVERKKINDSIHNEIWLTPCRTNYCNMDGTGQYWTDRIDNVRMIDEMMIDKYFKP